MCNVEVGPVSDSRSDSTQEIRIVSPVIFKRAIRESVDHAVTEKYFYTCQFMIGLKCRNFQLTQLDHIFVEVIFPTTCLSRIF